MATGPAPELPRLRDTGSVRSEDTPFVGGPLDGRVLPVLLGPTGHPPKVYRVPVPDAAGGPPTVLVYRRVPGALPHHPKGVRDTLGRRLGLHLSWTYAYDPDSTRAGGSGLGRGLRWPWSKPSGGD